VPFFPRTREERSVEEKRRDAEEWMPKAEAAAERAIALEPMLPTGYSSLGLILVVRSQFVRAEEMLLRALAADPYDPETLHTYANMLGALGRVDEGAAMKRRLLNMEPFVAVYTGVWADLLWASGYAEEALSELADPRFPNNYPHRASLYWSLGRDDEAIDVLTTMPPGSYPADMVETALRFLSNGPAEAEVARRLPRLGHRLDFVYFRAGVPERTLERFEDDVAAGYLTPNTFLALWTPLYAPLRPSERFKALLRDAGVVDYWRVKGWPEFCQPKGGDDFTCH
jgi:tetratricopeptide (TPR) repeat protein